MSPRAHPQTRREAAFDLLGLVFPLPSVGDINLASVSCSALPAPWSETRDRHASASPMRAAS
jgi:hypothetical protein